MTDLGCTISLPPNQKVAFERALKRWPDDKSLGTAMEDAIEGQELRVELNSEFLIILHEELAKEAKNDKYHRNSTEE